jgi:hypothetical protein
MKRNAEKPGKVMTIANSLVAQGIGRSEAMSKAWTFGDGRALPFPIPTLYRWEWVFTGRYSPKD